MQTFDENAELGVGTCAVLRHFAGRIKQDFVLLPCDFVPPSSFSLTNALDKFRLEATFDGAIATTCFFEVQKSDKNVGTEEWGSQSTPVPVVWDKPSGTLLYIDTPDEVDKNSEDLQLNMALLSK